MPMIDVTSAAGTFADKPALTRPLAFVERVEQLGGGGSDGAIAILVLLDHFSAARGINDALPR